MTQEPTSLYLSSTLPSSYESTLPALKVLGGSDRTLGNRKRTVPSSMPSIEADSVTQATAIHELTRESRKKRLPGLTATLAVGLGAAVGLAGVGAAATTACGAAETVALAPSAVMASFVGRDRGVVLGSLSAG